MPLTLADQNVAILAANGFDENQVTEIQRALVRAKAHARIVSSETGVVNGWQGDGWGHYFNVDALIGEALGSDFDMLVLPGGERSTDKLKQNLHTRRIVGHFVDANKPVAAIGSGVGLLALVSNIAGRTVAAAPELRTGLETAGINVGDLSQEIDGNLLTSTGEDLGAWVGEVLEFFADADIIKRAA